MKFIIKAFDYVDSTGGIIVLHKLADVLGGLGHETYIICNKTFDGCKAQCITEEQAKNILSQDNGIIVIYPEGIVGNPLQAKNVVRWVLYIPGGHGDDPSVYDSSEHVFLYIKEFGYNTIYENNPILFTFIPKTDIFYDKKLERSGDCFIRRKGNKINTEFMPGYYLDYDMAKNSRVIDDFLLYVFNKYERVISYDVHTYHSVIAAMCGCTSIVLRDPSLSPERFYNGLTQYGIAYGFEDEAHAKETKHLVKQHINDIYKNSLKTVNSFLEYCKDNFY